MKRGETLEAFLDRQQARQAELKRRYEDLGGEDIDDWLTALRCLTTEGISPPQDPDELESE